jgi:hypothetical protein
MRERHREDRVRSDICWHWRYLEFPLFGLATHSHSEQNTLAPLCRHLPHHPRGAVGRTQPNGPMPGSHCPTWNKKYHFGPNLAGAKLGHAPGAHIVAPSPPWSTLTTWTVWRGMRRYMGELVGTGGLTTLHDSNHPFTPNPTEAGGESVLSFLSLRALAHACAPGAQELFLQRNTSETARGPGDRNTVQARYGCHPSQQTH